MPRARLFAQPRYNRATLLKVGNALHSEVKDVAGCLKAVRGLARRQFLVRELLTQARLVGGL
jgi:hypothetical protein